MVNKLFCWFWDRLINSFSITSGMAKQKQQKRYAKRHSEHASIALERIGILFSQAAEMFNRDKALSNRYVSLARRISMKYKVRIPSELKRRFCKHCLHYLVPGKNCAIRLKDHSIVCYCKDCGKASRMPYSKEQKAKRLKNRQ